MKYFLFLATVIFSAISIESYSKQIAAPSIVAPSNSCALKENVTVNVSFNFKANSFPEAKTKFDSQVAKVTEFAKSQAISKLEVQNQNYNISSNAAEYGQNGQPIRYDYQLSGNTTYKIDNSAAAFKFAEFLNKQNMQVGINSDAYRQGDCAY
jgi:hypothetical protein